MARAIAALWLAMGLILSTAGPGALAEDPPVANPFAGDAAAAEAGKTLFSRNCERCHGANAVIGLMPRNLRRLRIRHGDAMATAFWTTVHTGRPARGMPSWQGVIADDDLWRILTFLESIQDSD